MHHRFLIVELKTYAYEEQKAKIMEMKKIPVEAMRKLPMPMNLIKIVPESFDYLDSDLKKEGFASRQHME